jgi:hypothetical protein
MRMYRFVLLAVLAAALAVAAGAGTTALADTADLQKAVAPGNAGADHRNSSWETDTGAQARAVPPGLAVGAIRTVRPSPDGEAPPWGEGRGLGPNHTVPVGPVIAVPAAIPEVTPVLPGVRFGQRRYLPGGPSLTPPIGNATVPGRAIGLARRGTVTGTGTATGLAPPGRFVRWSPAGRWRSGAT